MATWHKARGSVALLGLLCAAALCLVPAAASAASVDLEGGHLRFDAAPGESNYLWNLHYGHEAAGWELADRNPFSPLDPECELEPTLNFVTCAAFDGPLSASVALGDGNDKLQHMATWESENEGPVIFTPLDEPFALDVDGGPGDDEFWTSASGAPMSLLGGEGNDQFQFFPQDVAGTHGLPGRYLLDGGPGNDWLQVHGSAPAPVAGATLTMEGGSGDDFVMGSKGADLIRGGPGFDRLVDLEGNDWIDGGEDNDAIFGSAGADFLAGGPGDDELMAGPTGQDRFDGGPGNDRITSKNSGIPDEVSCGEGIDKVDFDLLADVIAIDCERLVIPVKCSWGVTCGATITVKALAPGRPLLGRAKQEFRGRSWPDRLPLSAKGRAYVSQRGLVTVIRTIRIKHPAKDQRKARVVTKHVTVNLKAS